MLKDKYDVLEHRLLPTHLTVPPKTNGADNADMICQPSNTSQYHVSTLTYPLETENWDWDSGWMIDAQHIQCTESGDHTRNHTYTSFYACVNLLNAFSKKIIYILHQHINGKAFIPKQRQYAVSDLSSDLFPLDSSQYQPIANCITFRHR